MVVDRVSAALDSSHMVEDGSSEDGDSENSNEIMSDDEPDNLMTLDQYKEEARRESLIRKGHQASTSLPKKGRVGNGERCL